MKHPLILLALGSTLALPALAEPPKMMKGMAVDEHGMTLYMFDKDSKDTSTCAGACADNWPPAVADSYDKASGDWGMITRSDGKKQWTHKGHPLYRWSMDKKPGDMNGEGFKGMWHTVKP
ncbi:COG4315 family predicted lipoprotein [Pseudogulbenkiania subflava]|uniref:Predicted lipoprotein with conserved Yx(FWY)xxD motif n=1 Tax=Pseudogulbenkiania subflava DSM 22618 TaxID=1123014 RepID=A0A1Y6BVZ4_9NEIS|nr:hypothetical protein [Pseudogulbenkiania subflava]SMF22819.1 Predicted lipoprotein with conserved Yx(FWY)xxD motif [Pseudogulbenkiania subflava DSM 22618]